MRNENVDITKYDGYQLDGITIYDMCEADKRLMDAIAWMIDNNASFEKTAENFDYPKTSLHRHFHRMLPHLSFEMYRIAAVQLKLRRTYII